MKRGQSEVNHWLIPGIVAVIILVVIFLFSSGAFGGYTKFVKYFNFNGSVEPLKADDGFLRYHLLEDTLEFSEDGSNWVKPEDDKTIKIQGKDFSFGLVKSQVEGFYFGKSVREDLEYPASFDAGAGNEYPVNVKFQGVIEKDNSLGASVVSFAVYDGFVENKLPLNTYFVNYKGDKIQVFTKDEEGKILSKEDFSKFHSSLVPVSILWRDSILKGNGNEQPATIGEGNYYVEKLGDYLVVRLNEPLK